MLKEGFIAPFAWQFISLVIKAVALREEFVRGFDHEAVRCYQDCHHEAESTGCNVTEMASPALVRPMRWSAGKHIARRCRDLAQARDWNAQALAEAAKISLMIAQRALSSDAGRVRLGDLERIAKAFECDPETLTLPFPGFGEK